MTSIYLRRIGTHHIFYRIFLIHIIKYAYQVFGAVVGECLFIHGVYANINTKYFFGTLDICFDLIFDTLFFFLFCEELAGTLGCMQREPAENLIPLDPEIERTLKRILMDKREATRMEQLSMGPMEENRDDDVGSTRWGSIHPDAANMDNTLPPIRDYGRPSAVTPPVIRRPAIQANNFELKSITLQLLYGIQFHGLAHEDSNAHILNFLEVCNTVKYNGVSDDAIRLRLFPFSLKEKAKHWLISEHPDSITSWDDLSNKFLARFFPPAKAAKLRIDISSFYQYEGESFYEAWERFKDLLRKCPHHSFTKWMQVHHFYNGLSHPTMTLIDASVEGAIMGKNEVEAYQILENIALNDCQWPVKRVGLKKLDGVFDLDMFTNLSAQVSTLSKQLQTSQQLGSQ